MDDVLDDLPGVVAVYGVEQLAALLPAAAQHIDFRWCEDALLDLGREYVPDRFLQQGRKLDLRVEAT
ncbi:MAG TPA: hypothetical protein VHZ03_02225 [Trebonia sp.]|nr:hypothetical protein [Trebonia sp.]